MKSGKQKRLEIKAARLKRAKKLAGSFDPLRGDPPKGSVPANHEELQHNNTYGILPNFYFDKPFVCKDCGSWELWTAKQQKWWYEIAKGDINSTAVRCRPCRKKERDRKERARETHFEGLERKNTKAPPPVR